MLTCVAQAVGTVAGSLTALLDREQLVLAGIVLAVLAYVSVNEGFIITARAKAYDRGERGAKLAQLSFNYTALVIGDAILIVILFLLLVRLLGPVTSIGVPRSMDQWIVSLLVASSLLLGCLHLSNWYRGFSSILKNRPNR